MVVKRSFLYSPFLKFPHYGLDLIFSENQVAHHHGCSAISFECRPRTQCEGWLDIDAFQRDMQVLSRHTELDHVTGLDLSGTTHCILYLLPVALTVLGTRNTSGLS